MKGSLSFIVFALVIVPFKCSLIIKTHPSQSKVESKSEDTFPVLILTETALYEKYVCVGNPDGLRLLVPGSCSKYYECSNGTATVNSCDSLTPYYDSIGGTCVAQSSCVERSIEGIGGPLGCIGVCCSKATGLYVDPDDKTKFYFCSNNVGVLHSCCSGQQFNPITKACDVPANCP